jgi:hypothetical protein
MISPTDLFHPPPSTTFQNFPGVSDLLPEAYREINDTRSEVNMNSVNTMCGHNVEWFYVKLGGRLRSKCDGTRVETRFRLSAKRTSPFKSAGASVQSTTGRQGVRISGSNAGYTMFRGSVKSTGYPLHSPVPPSLPLPCVTVRHHTSTGL